MKQFRRLATRILVPLALLATIAASAVPASAATVQSGNSQGQNTTVVSVKPNSINW
jgi:hypothetical protein